MTALLPSAALGGLPDGLRAELLGALTQIITNYRTRKWEPSELNGGKLCEVVYSILKGHVEGSYPERAKKPRNMVAACSALEQAPGTFPRSVRIGVPRALVALYEIRNNRNVGHVGGDVDPNHMDSAVVLAMAKWVVAELVRIFHDVSTEEAAEVVELLSQREVPIIWEQGDVRRVLDPSLDYREETLVLLYGSGEPVRVADLLRWTEYGNPSRYRSTLLMGLHKKRLVEFNLNDDTVLLTPLGAIDVETSMPLHIAV